jgi:aldehyde:ferredoxin oxidoreductase
MPCSRLVDVTDNGKRVRLEGPEYETLGMLGSNLGISDPATICQANLICDRLGMDTISAGGVLGFAMECVERGLLKDQTVSDLRFGNGDAALRLLKDIAHRRGIGDLMAEGVRVMAREIGGGSERFAMHVKGLELPAYDPRAGFGTALTYAVTPRGGCHRRAWPPAKEVLGGVPPYTVVGKAAMVKEMFDERAILHSLVACDFHPSALPISLQEYAEFVAAVTGYVFTPDEWSRTAERIETTIRLFNIRAGLGREDDTLPPRLLEEALPDGPAKGQMFGHSGLSMMLDEYYSLRGWDQHGVPLPATLNSLNMPE